MDEVKEINQQIKEWEAEAAEYDPWVREFLLTLPNLPDASVPVGTSADDNPVIKTWGEPPRFAFEPKAHWDIGEALGILDFERAAKITGARFALLKGAWAPTGAGADQLHAGPAHPPARLHRGLAPFHGQRRLPARHRPVAQVRRRPVQARGHGPLADSHRRSAGDQHPPGRNPGGRPADLLHRLHPLLPLRGRLLRHGRPRPHPPAPVRQGGAGEIHPSGDLLRGAGATDRGRRGRSCSSWVCPTASSCCAPATWASPRPRPTTSKSGCRGRTPTGKFRPAPTSSDFQARRVEIRFKRPGKGTRTGAHPERLAAWRWAAPWWPFWKTTSRKMAAFSSPRSCALTWGAWKR